ncbi:MAG: hypothetical protein ACRDKW_10690 [Actinomycetota bacterium]
MGGPSDDAAAARAAATARRLVADGVVGDTLARASGRVGPALPVVGSDGATEYWFVPVVVGDPLVGFVQLDTGLRLLRYASFQRQPGSLEGCPDASLWTDAEAVRSRAAVRARPGESPQRTFLTYDGNPSRLAWAVELTGPGGEHRTVMVAGDHVYEPR